MKYAVTVWRGREAAIVFEYDAKEGEAVSFGLAKADQNKRPDGKPRAMGIPNPRRREACSGGSPDVLGGCVAVTDGGA